MGQHSVDVRRAARPGIRLDRHHLVRLALLLCLRVTVHKVGRGSPEASRSGGLLLRGTLETHLLSSVGGDRHLRLMRHLDGAAASTVVVCSAQLDLFLGLASRRQESTESLAILKFELLQLQETYFRDSLVWLPEGQSVPAEVFGAHSIQVYDALVTTGAVDGPHWLLREHCVIRVMAATCRRQLFNHVVQLFQLNQY